VKLANRGLPVLVASTAIALVAMSATAIATPTPTPSRGANPYSPSSGHPYRHGAVPTLAQQRKMKAYDAQHPATTAATGPETLSYGGGIDGIGVTSSTPKVYLVFWGNQWGSQGTDGAGNVTLSGDTNGGAPYIQKLFKGLGTGGEGWSGTMTQYCDGSGVVSGATSCAAGAAHIGYPTGGPYAGVWYDNSAAEPSAASGHQIGVEAVNAAAHFGNTTPAANRYSQYVILSAPGLNPDNYMTGGFCAWHDYNGDSTLSGGGVSSPYGDIAFTNMPYTMDEGASCGQGFVNSPGTLDGYSIVEGHEYAETITDQNPAGGWTNQTTSSFAGQENGDECAWISSGQGASANVSTGGGSFAMQSTWSNDTNRCDITHATIGGSTGNTVTVTNPGSKTGTVGTATSLQIVASDSGSGTTLTYSATGLPTSLTINSASGLISGTPTAAGTFSVTAKATDNTGASGSATFTWTIHAVTGNTVTVTNPGSKTGTVGTATSLQLSATDSGSGTTLTFTATGLPTGLTISSSGLISGTPTAAGTFSVTAKATDNTGASGTTVFTWTISTGGTCPSPGQKLGNPGFESGRTVWAATAGVIAQNGPYEPAHSGTWDAWLDGYGTTHTDTLSQSVTIPAGCHATLSFYLHIDTAETTTTTAYDKLTVKVGSTTLVTYSNLNKASGYSLKTFDVSSFAGQTVTLLFTGTEDSSLQTSFVLDDTSVLVS
jgi:hypothetical protein